MKTKLFLAALIFGFAGQIWGQEIENSDEETKKTKEFFIKINDNFKQENAKFESLKKDFDNFKSGISINSLDIITAKLDSIKLKVQSSKRILDSIQKNALAYEIFFSNEKKINTDSIDKWIIDIKKYNSQTITDDAPKETKIYTFFGKDRVIDNDILKNKTGIEAEIFKDVLVNKGEESYLGDITIPKDGQQFNFYNCKLEEQIGKTFKFKKLDVEICDGYFKDIVVYVEDDDKNTHVFTNQIGISLLFYGHRGRRKLMYYKYSIKKNAANNKYTDKGLDSLYIKVTDVMGYSYKIGNHYIPNDLAIQLPNKDTDNSQSNTTYQIKQETHLEKILELRTYTDFLALFGDSDNGLAQIEGRAKFYLFPYPFRFLWSKKTAGQVEYLSSMSPFVNFSKFDSNSRYIIPVKDSLGNYQIDQNFDLIEKRFLTMGIEAEVLKWQHKNAPVKLSLYGLINYNISEINLGTNEDKDLKSIKAMAYGGGLHLSTKRFNNFGFDYKAELSWFDYKNFNNYDDIVLPDKIPVFRGEAEIFYHPNGNPNQAIFTRLITYNYRGSIDNQAFYQFQFGYKFAIGNRTINQ